MNKNANTGLGKALTSLIWLGAVAAWIAFGLYVYNFGPGNWFKLSSNQSDWGLFGDYIGGVLNPYFSFLAFIGVTFTVVLQARQLDIVREQANNQEMQRVISALSSHIDDFLASSVAIDDQEFSKTMNAPKSMYRLIAAIGTMCLEILDGKSAKRPPEFISKIEQLQDSVFGEISMLCLDFETLAWTLQRYEKDGGSESVIDFYKYRYCAVLVWLDVMGFLSVHGKIQNFFKPKDSYQYFREERVE
jgi:hypothetical protein